MNAKAKTGAPQFLPLSIVRTIWKRKLSICCVWITIAGAAGYYIHELPPVYKAETLILVDSQKIPEKYVSSTVSTDLEDRLATIKQQILSSTRLKTIITDLNLYSAERKTHVEEDILESMRKSISVTLERGWTGNRPGAFRIGFEGSNPVVVSQVATRIASLYIESNMKTREEQAAGTTDFIQSQLEEAQKALDEIEARIGAYKAQHNGELPQQETVLSSSLNRLQMELQADRDAINQAQERKLLLENSMSSEESALMALTKAAEPVDTTRSGQQEPRSNAVPAPVSELSNLEAQLDALRQKGRSDSHPDVKKLLLEIKDLKAAQAAQAPTTAGSVKTEADKANTTAPLSARAPALSRDSLESTRIRDRITNLKVTRDIANQDIERLKLEERRILKDMSDIQARIQKLPLREQEMAKLTRDYQDTQALYRSLLEKKQSAEMATDLEHRQKSERFTVLDAARVPEKPIKPNRPVLYAIAMLGSLLFGVGLGLVLELKQDVFLGEWEFPRGTPILARVPYMDLATIRHGSNLSAGVKRGLKFSSVSVLLLLLLAVGTWFLRNR